MLLREHQSESRTRSFEQVSSFSSTSGGPQIGQKGTDSWKIGLSGSNFGFAVNVGPYF